jgi:hypothetical protein
MSKYFPKLTQTEVFIQTDENGGGFNCPMLPVSALSKIEEFSQELKESADKSDIKAIGKIRLKMIELAQTVMPAEYHDSLFRLDIPKCTELLAYLMYGDPENDDQPKKAEKN